MMVIEEKGRTENVKCSVASDILSASTLGMKVQVVTVVVVAVVTLVSGNEYTWGRGCWPPTAPMFGFVSPARGYIQLGSTATFSCKDRYWLYGPASTLCTLNGITVNTPKCIAEKRPCDKRPCGQNAECNNLSPLAYECICNMGYRKLDKHECQRDQPTPTTCDPWTYGQCSVTCGSGKRSSRRLCSDGTTETFSEDCSLGKCPSRGDCTYGPWGPWEPCGRTSTGVREYTRKRSREMWQPRNGGKSCPRQPTLMLKEACTESKALADTFILQFLSPGRSSGIAAGRQKPAHKENTCKEFRDAQNRILMSGGDCSSKTRRKRDLDGGSEEIGEAPMTRDILFLLDESGSIGATNFEFVKNAADALIFTLCNDKVIDQEITRVVVASFDKLYHVHFDMVNKHMNDRSAMLKSIRDIKYNVTTEGETCLVRALNESRKMFHEDRGGRKNSESLLVLVTDGCHNCETGHTLEDVKEELSKERITMLTLHIDDRGSGCPDILKALHVGERCWEVLDHHGWEKFEEFIRGVKDSECGFSNLVDGVNTCGGFE